MFSKTKSRRKRSLHRSSPGRPIRQVVRRLGREYLLCYVNTAPYNTFSLRFFLEQKLTHLFILPPTGRILTHDVYNACLYITHFWTFTLLALSLLGLFYQIGGRTAFGYNQVSYHESETVHFLLLSTSNNILYVWEESILIPYKNTPYFGP